MAEEPQNPSSEEVYEAAPKEIVSPKEDPPVIEEAKVSVDEQVIAESISFKEESNLVGELPEPHKKALDELKAAVQEALSKREFSCPPPEEPKPAEEAKPEGEECAKAAPEEPPKECEEKEEEPPVEAEEVFLWGIPIIGDEKSDVVLLKFLRARDFKVKEALTMIKNTVKWRKEFGIDALLEEDFGSEYEKAFYVRGVGKEGHPVFYNAFGAFEDKDFYHHCFADEEKRTKFLRWRIQQLEKNIRKLDFSPSGICTFVHVNDFKNFLMLTKRDIRNAANQALQILQDNYPEFVAKQVFINVSWWYLAFNRMISPFLTQRTKSKFVYAGPSKSAETLFRYMAPEHVPVHFGGLHRDGEKEFCESDAVTEAVVKPSSKHTVEFPVTESCRLAWELRVIGWEASYGAEFVPSHEEGYTVIVSKTRKVSVNDDPVVSDTYMVGEAGKIVVTIENLSSRKKKLLYRSKSKPLAD